MSDSYHANNVQKRENWIAIQKQLARRVCVTRTVGLVEHYAEEDADEVMLFTPTFTVPQGLLTEAYALTVLGPQLQRDAERCNVSLPSCQLPLRFVGGVDISFVKGTDLAVACLAIMEYPSMRRCRTFLHHCAVTEPYVPGFLAFREVAPLMELMKKVRSELCEEEACFPQLLIVDGCGVHHPLRCGLASHLGVLLDIPTVGCAKNFMEVDGMTRETIDLLFDADMTYNTDDTKRATAVVVKPIIGQSGALWGYAAIPNGHAKKPIFISPGHRIGYAEAAALVLSMCKYRVPEPIRAADFSSREYIRQMTYGNVNGDETRRVK